MSSNGLKKKENKENKNKLNGVVYTPKWIVEVVLNNLNYIVGNNIHSKKIIDPTCGDGAFLKEVVERFIIDALNSNKSTSEIKNLLEHNIYGIDIDKDAIEMCRNNLNNIAKKYGIYNVNWNLINNDSTETWISKLFKKFDYVVGNPPYIRIQNLGKEKRSKIQKIWKLCKSGSTDIYIAFFELGYYLLNNTGELGYITPNTYIKTSAGKDIRLFIKNKKILRSLIDFRHHQVFENATTYSLITILSKTHGQNKFKLYYGDADKKIEFIDEIDLNNLNDDNWILCPNDLLIKIKEIENRGAPLGKIADIHVGITTLADSYYIFKDPVFKENTAIIKLKDGREFEIEKDILKPIVKASVLKSSDEEQNRYVIFPYKLKNGKHTIIPEDELKEKYPLTYDYFLKIKDILLARDKGKPNPVAWYAFGRSQGLDTSFGKKILTSPLNKKPNFIVWEKEDYTFYAGYCIKYDGDLHELAKELNSSDMEFYINHVSRSYQNNYKSYSKTFIKNFGISNPKIIKEFNKRNRDKNKNKIKNKIKNDNKNINTTLLDYLNSLNDSLNINTNL
ncbi:Eco57I restriction-modification methylase domain-containing protein [Methanothermococcus sp.]|uniref:Eco57I restriction-modification methylase domain-containing protein n=1 Tax=Methanothermococcus sp. TaxID=2614238 RepID=UPI0025D90343|nr:N-6 DNA methylase [Methanothermococcus sp.]